MIFKSIKKAFAWFSILIVLFMLLIGGGYIALRSPKVQTRLTQYIATYLSEELNTEVSVKGVDIGFFNRLILEGLYVQDLKGDTLAYLSDLHLGLKSVSLEKHEVKFNKVRIDDLKFYLHKYEGDEKLSIQFLLDYFAVPKDTTKGPTWGLTSTALELRNASFQLRNHYSESTSIGIDYKDLDVRNINLLISEIKIDVDTIFGNVERINCRENRGFFLKDFKGIVKVSPSELKVDDLVIQTASSDLSLDLHYTYRDWSDYLTFIDSVRMDYTFRESVINFKDISFFAPALTGLSEVLKISGRVYGPVSRMNARNLKLSYGNSTMLEGDLDLDGLPDIRETFLHFNLKRFKTRYSDLIKIPIPPFENGKHLQVPANISNLGELDFKGTFTGFVNDFVANGKLITSIGQLRTDISLKQNEKTGQLAYNGELQSIGFDIGKFLEDERLGKVTLSAKVTGSGITKEEINAVLVGNVNSAELIGYDYKKIEVNGEFARSMFSGEVSVNDTNVALIFRGGFDISQQLPQFNFHADVTHANLYELHLLQKREGATISGVMDVDFTGNDIDNLIGTIEISNGTYQQEGDARFSIDKFSLDVTEFSGKKNLKLRSGIVDADFNGKFNFRNIPKAVNNLLRKHLPSYAKGFEQLKEDEGLEFDFNIDLKSTELLTYLFAKDLAVSDSSNFSGSYSSVTDEIFLRGKLKEVSFKSVVFDNIQIEAENPRKEFRLGVFADKVKFTDSLYLASFEMTSFTFEDSLGLVVKWNNKTKIANKAFIQGVASFPKNEEVSFHLEESKITVAGLDWVVQPDNLLQIDTTEITFTNFRFLSGNQSIGLNGKIAKDPNAKLNVRLKNFDLQNFNLATQRSGLTLDGIISGSAQISGVYDKLFLTNQLEVDSLVVNNVLIGTGELNNTWIPATKSIQVFGLFQRGDATSLSVVGEFLPGNDRKQNFNIKAMIDQIPLSVFNPYIDKVITDVKGIAKADLSLKGTIKKPELSGIVILKEADLLFTYLNTRFSISDTVEVKPNGFYGTNLEIADETGKTGFINGWVKHENFKNIQFDARLEANDFLALNTNSAMNSLYYGKAYGTGNVHFFGNPKDMHLELSMKTERGTRFNIPLFGAKSVNESDFITFVKPKGTESEVKIDDEFKVTFKNLTLDMDIEVTSEAEVQLIFDPKVGDIIKGKGDGDINMSLDRSGNFKMFGNYYINKGEYLFTLQNIINKKFLIEQGGTINWSGSPYDALINIEARYGVRTALYDLMYPDTSDIYRKRIQVDCILTMTDNLLNPNITFDVDLPNSDEATKTDVRNKIGVGNIQEMNRQVFGLLVLNRFFPTEDQNQALQQAGGFFQSSSAEMVSNQLSSWLSKISNDFDIGLNYRPGDNVTSDEVQASLSTQLFNNRILVDGNVGVANTQSSSSNIVGDVNIEYKITSDGRFRVRAFNKSNDINTLVNNAPFTQGVGLSYQQDFDKLSDLFKKWKKKTDSPK
ncbi:MAG: translocation/assembly module TamB domain-containing protein [Flavobacteriales bacterium]|nr:translocation/assembly module TamB domain-containing protein [Flavobacteriales bacterium]